jgi:hypothetical protein
MSDAALSAAIGLARLNAGVAEEVAASTRSICGMLEGRPEPQVTALVVGRIQSGKTLSFTTLLAAMADRGVRLAVVLAGTKKLLCDQTRERLRLGLPERRFAVMDRAVRLDGLLPDGEPNPFFASRTLVFVVLKNPAQIRKLTRSLKAVGPDRLGKCLVIDDEADAAGLNTMLRQGDQSATYRAITELRAGLPRHWYVQYTATPQANLLLPLMDHLSPDCVHVLEPGSSYVGGDAMLRAPHAVQPIPASDQESAEAGRCPDGLAAALMQFLVGLAHLAKMGGDGCHSMMVHPSPRIRDHSSYEDMVRARLDLWRDLSETDDECRAQLAAEVRAARDDLARSCPAVLDTVRPEEIAAHFRSLASEVQVQVLNSAAGSASVNWSDARGWILVGGANLDRGFTIEGLTVTYMPRGMGQANVDTLQQRGRFFGHIRDRLPLVRVHLDPEMIMAYRDIAEHEAHVHLWLRSAAKDARDAAGVRGLRRAFLLDERLRPTRREVMDPSVDAAGIPEVLLHRTAPAHLRLSEANGEAIDRWIGAAGPLEWTAGPGEAESRRHQIARDVPLPELLGVIEQLQFGDPEESERWISLCAAIRASMSGAGLGPGSVMLMRPLASPERAAPGDEIRDLLQGRGESNDYPGDRGVAEGSVCLQLHRVHVRRDDGKLMPKAVPVVAVILSKEVPRRLVTLQPAALP